MLQICGVPARWLSGSVTLQVWRDQALQLSGGEVWQFRVGRECEFWSDAELQICDGPERWLSGSVTLQVWRDEALYLSGGAALQPCDWRYSSRASSPGVAHSATFPVSLPARFSPKRPTST